MSLSVFDYYREDGKGLISMNYLIESENVFNYTFIIIYRRDFVKKN
ncbi:hypothetical protein T190607A02C_70025 [Tenacibaculum sp. 190524A02b]